MSNQYIWLYNNKDKYEYKTQKAKSLYSQLANINISTKGEVEVDEMNKLTEYYEKFVGMFNNNPFLYKNALKEQDIETNDFDCYFIKANEKMLPIGYYKINRCVESVVLLNNKISKQKEKAYDVKERLSAMLKDDVEKLNDKTLKFKSAKKANYFRALVALLSVIVIIWSFIKFLKLANIINIIKSIGNIQSFKSTVSNEMLNMSFLSLSGIDGWICILILHIILTIIALKCFKDIKEEFKLAYEKNITFRQSKSILKTLDSLNASFELNMENDENSLYNFARQGKNETLNKNHIAKSITKIRDDSKVATKYLEKAFNELRGIKNNWTILFLVVTAIACYFAYGLMSNIEFTNNFDRKIFEMNIDYDRQVFRSKKIVQITTENCAIYSSSSDQSQVKYNLPIWTEVELIEKKDIGEEGWSKIKKITDDKFVVGWVPTIYTAPYNKVDYSLFNEIPIVNTVASSYLTGNSTKYIPNFAIDWNRDTSWQDGNYNLTGEGEYITLNFNKVSMVKMIQIFPGNSKSEDLYLKNERIKKAKIKFSNGKAITYEFDDNFNETYQTVWLNNSVETESITIEVLETYMGDEYCDLCLSEIHAYSSK